MRADAHHNGQTASASLILLYAAGGDDGAPFLDSTGRADTAAGSAQDASLSTADAAMDVDCGTVYDLARRTAEASFLTGAGKPARPYQVRTIRASTVVLLSAPFGK